MLDALQLTCCYRNCLNQRVCLSICNEANTFCVSCRSKTDFKYSIFSMDCIIISVSTGFVVDFFNIVIAPKEGINILGTHWSGNRLVILTGKSNRMINLPVYY